MENNDDSGLVASLESSLSDLRRAEETIKYQHRQLYRMEVRYNELFNSLGDAFCVIEVLFDNNDHPVDYRFLKVNSVFEEQTGIRDPLGRTMREIAPEHEQHWFDTYGRIALTGESLRFEHRAEALGRFYDVYAFRIGDPKDAQVAILFKDIAERKRREELQAYLLRLSDTLRSLSDAVQIQEAVTQLAMDQLAADRCYYCEIENGNAIIRSNTVRSNLPLSSNAPFSNFTIVTNAINAGQPFVVYDAHTEPALDEVSRQACIQFQAISLIVIPVVKEGKPRGGLGVACCAPRKWDAGEMELVRETAERTWIAVEQAKAGEALRESEENYRSIVNQSIAGILKVCLGGNIMFTNDQFSSMLGYSGSELLKLNVNDLIYAEDQERNRLAFTALVSAGTAYEIEKRLVRKDGGMVWVNNHISPIFDKRGKVEAATIVSIDISRQKELERQKDEFIGIASHELKTPITSIKAYGEILAGLMDKSTAPIIVQLVTKMNAQVIRLVKLIYSLLNTSRISGGQLTLQLEPVDLNALLGEHVLQGQLTTSKHHIAFVEQQLPLVFADTERLGQVVDNLLSNAIKYAPKGGDILVRTESRGNYVRVSIVDFGMGIPKAAQEKIFDRFYRVKEAATEAVSGIGLGLYICREIIEKHQGRMGVESVQDEGSTFYFELPIYRISE